MRTISRSKIIILMCLPGLVIFAAIGALTYANMTESTEIDHNPSSQTQPNEEVRKDVRQAIWEQLPEERRVQIKGTWESGELTKTVIDENFLVMTDGKSEAHKFAGGREVYLIDFTTNRMTIPNNMIIVADADTFELLGYAPVD